MQRFRPRFPPESSAEQEEASVDLSLDLQFGHDCCYQDQHVVSPTITHTFLTISENWYVQKTDLLFPKCSFLWLNSYEASI